MAVATPAVPASTVAVANPTGQYVSVNIAGGTMTNVSINGITAGAGAGNYMIPPGGTITMTYSVAPTWTWTDPQDLGYSPGYSTMNTGAEWPGYSPLTAMPLFPHAAVGQAGLGTGVTN